MCHSIIQLYVVTEIQFDKHFFNNFKSKWYNIYVKHIYPQEVLITLFNTLFPPHLNYCILVWGSKIYTDHRLHLLKKTLLEQ